MAGVSITGTPSTSRSGITSSLLRTHSISCEVLGWIAPTTTSWPRSCRLRPSSSMRNDLPTPEAYPRNTFSRPRRSYSSSACTCCRSSSGVRRRNACGMGYFHYYARIVQTRLWRKNDNPYLRLLVAFCSGNLRAKRRHNYRHGCQFVRRSGEERRDSSDECRDQSRLQGDHNGRGRLYARAIADGNLRTSERNAWVLALRPKERQGHGGGNLGIEPALRGHPVKHAGRQLQYHQRHVQAAHDASRTNSPHAGWQAGPFRSLVFPKTRRSRKTGDESMGRGDRERTRGKQYKRLPAVALPAARRASQRSYHTCLENGSHLRNSDDDL